MQLIKTFSTAALSLTFIASTAAFAAPRQVQDTTVTTQPPPPIPSAPLPPDRDGDGFNALVDCDDLSAAIHPGAYDRPGDHIDQDCSGSDAPYERFHRCRRSRIRWTC